MCARRQRPLWFVAALGGLVSCCAIDGSRPVPPGYNELFGRGLSDCTEQCRPFGVSHFGMTAGSGGGLVYECECMADASLENVPATAQPDAPGEDPSNTSEAPLVRGLASQFLAESAYHESLRGGL